MVKNIKIVTENIGVLKPIISVRLRMIKLKLPLKTQLKRLIILTSKYYYIKADLKSNIC